MNKKLKDYVSFTRKETIAIIVLLTVITLFIFLPDMLRKESQPLTVNPEIQQQLAQVLDSSAQQKTYSYNNFNDDNSEAINSNVVAGVMFKFDPNTLDEAGFKKLGLTDRNIKTLINYRSKGGRFRKPGDIKKIYGIAPAITEKLSQYVVIEGQQVAYNDGNSYNNYKPYEKKPAKIIDINEATVEDFMQLPGIGNAFANRILKYRSVKGGFAAVSDIAKTYGLPDSTYNLILPYLTLAKPHVEKININTASEYKLLQCPNMTKDMAAAIVVYRRQHGNYSTVAGIKNIIFINDDMYKKVEAGLSVE